MEYEQRLPATPTMPSRACTLQYFPLSAAFHSKSRSRHAGGLPTTLPVDVNHAVLGMHLAAYRRLAPFDVESWFFSARVVGATLGSNIYHAAQGMGLAV